MRATDRTEARILDGNNVLVAPPSFEDGGLLRDFFGTAISPSDLASGATDLSGKTVYLCGDVADVRASDLDAAERVFVVGELARGYEGAAWPVVDAGRVPVLSHGVGVYYRRFFDPGVDRFDRIRTEHAFQFLTESTKPGRARRTGIYLTPVTRRGDELHFRLLRCSTNLSGPTENFRETDTDIVDALNREAAHVFRDHAPLNHVLAQIYYNTRDAEARKQSKAKISALADKTKDMPANGVMAFCTFYNGLEKLRPLASDAFDYGHRGVSGLTKLHFRLKASAEELADRALPRELTLTLYPDSVFFMPLSTNRLYTHEIRSSTLDAESIPTRLGYVVRCSSAEAVHADGLTFLKIGGERVELAPPTPEGMAELRRLYAEENRSRAFVDYGDDLCFSMNSGDYLAPRV